MGPLKWYAYQPPSANSAKFDASSSKWVCGGCLCIMVDDKVSCEWERRPRNRILKKKGEEARNVL